ncbi:hypothetical protein PAHAL_1G135500 [Panicum hallii]|uniref:GDSL esterase/lipase n=1 Tax=Panicum hallii TaxID=206008 RepID=A0A2S3GP28_9POAL|nr:hypothetical protein PAHAL_1G135500 [Panicum hallii]
MGDAPRANQPYYGVDFPNSEPTGQFSNGYNIADFIAKALGFQMSPPAYRSHPTPSPSTMEGFTGVNYAFANAGITESTNAQMTISLKEQVESFAATRARLKALLGGRKPPNNFLSKSLFLIGVGTMDLLPRLIDMYNNTFTVLHGMGARKFGIINIGLIGRLPSVQMSRCSGDASGLNRRAAEFNAALGTILANLATKFHRFRYSLADFYSFSNTNFANPSATDCYFAECQMPGTRQMLLLCQVPGFTNTNNACCSGLCATYYYDIVCSERMEYWFWDDFYTTEKAAKLAAAAFYSGKAFTAPVNIRRLIAMKG